MKKLFLCSVLLCSFAFAKAEPLNFSYTASADLVSNYVWRGLYMGGLSFQPELAVGWESEHTSFSFGTWMSFGASDWGFRSGLPVEDDWNPNTYFVKEFDVIASMNLWGVTFGFSHYYYLDGTNYFNFGDINEIDGSAQTEVNLGYDFSTLLPNVDLQLSFNTIVSGADLITEDGKRCYSSYIEGSYTHHFKHEIDLTGVVGFSPWKSVYTDYGTETPKNFAFNNLTLRVDKIWSFGVCDLDLYLQGTMNTCNLNCENAFIRASGDDKLGQQKLMGVIGLNISF